MDARVKTAISTMDQFFANELSIALLSKKVNLCAARLRQLFKKETGQSPLQYLRHLRMKRAEELLRNTFLSVKEVTHLSGFRDVSHFAGDFKRQPGMAPREFRAAEVSKTPRRKVTDGESAKESSLVPINRTCRR